MKFNFNKLKGRIVEIFGTQSKFAEALGKSDDYVSARINQKILMTIDEIVLWAEKLNIPDELIHEFFFVLEK